MRIGSLILALMSFSCGIVDTASETDLHASGKKPAVYTPRGIVFDQLYRAQENTLDAIMAVKDWNKDPLNQADLIRGVEVNLIVTQPKDAAQAPAFVLCHDENIKHLTGDDVDIRTLGKSEIAKHVIKQILPGNAGWIDYGKTRPFSYLKDLLDAFTQGVPPFMIWLGVKDGKYREGSSHTAIHLVAELEKQRKKYLETRKVDIFKYIIISSTNPFIVSQLDKESKKKGLQNDLTIFPDYSDFDLPLFLELKHFHGLASAFIDELGGFEKLFDLQPRWVSIQGILLNAERIARYHNKGVKIMGWGLNGTEPFLDDLDAILVWH
jgi:hypothetical protein